MAGAGTNPLLLRVATGVVLVVVALGAVWQGGMLFTALVAAAVLLMFAEWSVMHRLPRFVRLAGLVVVGGIVLLAAIGRFNEALLLTGFGAVIVGMAAFGYRPVADAGRPYGNAEKGARRAAAIGVLYCALPAIALIWVRGLTLGLAATVFLLVCVWSADIVAYFVGRSLGGPKLAPAISPNKTWSGAIGGVIGAMLVAGGIAVAYLASMQGQGAWRFIAIAGGLAMLSVLGDLYESHLKRRAGVKDSGTILPGHGGVMDRLDGLVPVAIAGAAIFAITGWAG